MTPDELQAKLQELMALPDETEWVEFKEARNNHHFDDLGRYFSALSNEANLKGQPAGWLVFGVTDKPPRQIVGSNYRRCGRSLDGLKQEVAQFTNHQITFMDVHELLAAERRVVMFQLPPAPRGIPTTWKGIAYGRIHDSLCPLSLQEIDQIRNEAIQEDWSAQICECATVHDLDPQAILFARQQYKKKNPGLAAEVDRWSDEVFLNKAKVCIAGQVTRTAVILLGRDESEHFLSPGVARITWMLKDAHREDYEHFGPPLLLTVGRVFKNIRNLTYRYLPSANLFPTEVTQYDAWVIRETLHNCIAHQDYRRGGRINVVEEPESLLFTNLGEFLPGTVEEAIERDAPPEFYRNRSLADAMVNLNMIDTIGGGIKRMFSKQRERSFPMPDYDLSTPGRVAVRIIGKVIDEKYTRMLMERTDLDLMHVIALDKVQKGKPLTDEELTPLKARKLVEGRRPNLYVSAKVAAATETRADYIRKRAFDKEHYKKLVVAYLEKFEEAKRKDLDGLLLKKVSDALKPAQKRNFIMNLIQEMRKEGTILNVSSKTGRGTRWALHKPASGDEN